MRSLIKFVGFSFCSVPMVYIVAMVVLMLFRVLPVDTATSMFVFFIEYIWVFCTSLTIGMFILASEEVWDTYRIARFMRAIR